MHAVPETLSASSTGKPGRMAVFAGAGIALGWAVHWMLLTSRHGGWLGLYSTPKLAAIVGAVVAGGGLAWWSRRTLAASNPEWVTVLVAASLTLLGVQLLGAPQLEIGTDITLNLLAVDQKLQGLKANWHTQLITTWGPAGPESVEVPITWYPPGPTWILAAMCEVTGLAPMRAVQVLWPACYLLNAWLLGKVLSQLAGGRPWLHGPWQRTLLAASVLWWITGCNPAKLVSADILALPFNLALLLQCLRLQKDGAAPRLWAVAGLTGGTIYLLKYSQFIVAAALLFATILLAIYRARNARQMAGAALGLAIVLAVPLLLTWMQGAHSAVGFTVKDTLAQSEYIQRRYGENYASASSPVFALLGCLGGLGWNGLGYGEWPELARWAGGIHGVNYLWELLNWNFYCSWCLVFGAALTPLAWHVLRNPSRERKPEWLLAGAGTLTVLLLAVVGWQKGYQWNVGLEGDGRLLLPLSAVMAGVLLAACGRHWGLALMLATIYVFGPWADYLERKLGPFSPAAAPSSFVFTTEGMPESTRIAQKHGAQVLLVLLDDLDSDQRFIASQHRMPVLGATVPVCFVQEEQLKEPNLMPKGRLALLDTPTAETVEVQAKARQLGIEMVPR